jgi:predicted DNA-binding ribbon-helix-helix protein
VIINCFIEREDTMETVEIQLNKQTFERVSRIAESRHCSIEDLIRDIIERIEEFKTEKSSFLGMFAEETELMDKIIESVMSARESNDLRK